MTQQQSFFQLYTIKWSIIALVIEVLFLFFVPITTWDAMGMFLTVFLSLLIAFLVFLTFMGIERFYDIFYLNEMDEPRHKEPFVILIPCLLFIVNLFIFGLTYPHRIKLALQERGVTTMASITNGQMTTKKSLRSTEVSSMLWFEFADQKGVKHATSANISNNMFHNVGLRQEVEVIYLPETPEINRLLIETSDIKVYKHIPNRNLDFDDIGSIVKLHPDSLLPFLNKISSLWKVSGDAGNRSYVNMLKGEEITFAGTDRIIMGCKGLLNMKEFIPKSQVFETRKAASNRNLAGLIEPMQDIYVFKDYTLAVMSNFDEKSFQVNMALVILKH